MRLINPGLKTVFIGDSIKCTIANVNLKYPVAAKKINT